MDTIIQNQKVLLTPEGLANLKKEYHELVDKKRPAAVDRIARAREQGDLAENSDYAAAKEDLAFIEGRITELEEIINSAKIVAITKGRKTIGLGCSVQLNINGKNEVFTIVGEWESDPKQKKISHSSPLGKALLGKKVGEEASVEAPAGRINYKILKIE